ncbi:Hypothetical protein PHPALM_4566 [Phytophthora palmivora]|uniref:Dynein light chain 1, cytoplasmic n=1 Tax=Phytophthora palmivora TaxID=4796 RepID=A0A2P4YJI4_9STRA|nr:Hypothetical protein PHPALM_4566 [Phytophthora palmivora]
MAGKSNDKFYKTVVFAEDMTDAMLEKALSTARDAFQTSEKTFSTIAEFVRRNMEKEYGRGWNCVVGSSFGAYVTHEIKTYVYFSVAAGVSVLSQQIVYSRRHAAPASLLQCPRRFPPSASTSRHLRLGALVVTSESKQKLLCLPSTFGSVDRDFRLQFASEKLTHSLALYGVDPRVPDQDFGRGRVERDADEVLRAADALELEQFSLLGCSHGANVSAVLAARHPERVSRLVLVNGNAFVSDEDLEDMEELQDVNEWPQEMREAAEAKYGDNLQNKWIEMVEALRCVEREDGGDLICDHLPYIKCKTLVVSGGQDKFVPSFHGEYLSERIMHSRLEVVAEGGNDLVLSEAERFNTLLETFLQEPDDKLTQSREFVAVPSKM